MITASSATTAPSWDVKEELYTLLPLYMSSNGALLYVISCATIVLFILFLISVSENWKLTGHRRFNSTLVAHPVAASGGLPTFVILSRSTPGLSSLTQSASLTLADNRVSIYKPTSAMYKHSSPHASAIPK